MELSAVLGFVLIAITLIVVPGPDWAYILTAGVRDHVVLPAVGGLMLGYSAITAVVAVGAGPIVARSPTALTALTLCGAAYLMHLGVKVLRSPVQIAAPRSDQVPASRFTYVLRGAGVSALNPKGLLIFVSILPQFAQASFDWPIPLQLMALGAIFTLACGLFYLPLGYTCDLVLSAKPAVARATTKIAGVVMVLVGLALITERLVETLN